MAVSLHYVIYCILGLVIVLLNAIIVMAIIKSPSLRHKKEYLVIVGLSVADVSYGLTFCWAGIDRLYLMTKGQQNIYISVWKCMQKPSVILKLYGMQLCSAMLTCISVDRLLAVLVPIWYFKQRAKYAYRLVGSFYLLVFVSCTALVYVSYSKRYTDFTPQTCLGAGILGKGLATKYNFGVRVLCGALSVFLYFLIPFVYRYHKSTSTVELNHKIKTQQKLMKTLGISAVFTLVFYVMPNLAKIFLVDAVSHEVWLIFGPYSSCLTLINPIANFFLYTLRHKDMRNAVFALIPGYRPKNKVGPVRFVVGKKKEEKPNKK